jgi:hypothetical protein
VDEHPWLYLAILLLALFVAGWLALQIVGFAFKLIFFALIVLIAFAAYQSWQAGRRRAR